MFSPFKRVKYQDLDDLRIVYTVANLSLSQCSVGRAPPSRSAQNYSAAKAAHEITGAAREWWAMADRMHPL